MSSISCGLSNFTVKEMMLDHDYVKHREIIYSDLKSKYDDYLKNQPRIKIVITLRDMRAIDGISWETTPILIAKYLKTYSLDELVISKVDGKLWDLSRPLEKSCTLEFLTFDDKEGKEVFWHSSAHVLGEACEMKYKSLICFGPPTDDGFYYDVKNNDNQVIVKDDYKSLESLAKKIISQKQRFERLEMSKKDLELMFCYSPYKCHYIRTKVPDGSKTTVYKCGPLIDLCLGPHIPHTGKIKAFKIMKNSSSYFLGDSKNDQLQRIYGISFPDKSMLDEYLKLKAEADERDHRKIGKEQELFFFHPLSPGSCFFLPKGTIIYNKLIDFLRQEYHKRGFSEVISPNIYNVDLWKVSGHWHHYKDNMFSFNVDKESTYALKPMNCPGHCLMFKHRDRSYKELPLRFADFGVLHRNELSGALSGLTRVRRFQQDDAHIFCREDQIRDEISGCLDFLSYVYNTFGFKYKLKLSTRPEKYMGELDMWNKAEDQLRSVLRDHCGNDWSIDDGDGAFYGPKIDITVLDAHKRSHQCATIQLDFQLPQRFELEYRTDNVEVSNSYKRPVIIHRAIFGSLERMMAMITESTGGKWPLWLSPKPAVVIPVVSDCNNYAKIIGDKLYNEGFLVTTDLSENMFANKIRIAHNMHINIIIIVGKRETNNNNVSIRLDDKKTVTISLEELIFKMKSQIDRKDKSFKLIL